ncbi:MAG: terminase large subunit [Methanosphaera sp. rholeuAM270]|nr:MAG: terminase large subunit [Methanosphaera sp. rholeuAM270]
MSGKSNQYNPCTVNIALWGKLITNNEWKPRHFDKIIIEFLYYALQGRVSKIMLSIPPRHGKSTLISKIFCSYFLANFPNEKVILSSYSQGLAAEFGGEVKNIINFHHEQTILKAGLSQDSKAKHKFHMEAPYTGQMLSVGSTGSILGFGAGLFIIDDPIRNLAEAESFTLQEKLKGWYHGTAKTRLEKRSNGLPPIMIVIAQRLHVNDLQGIIKRTEDVITAKEALELLRNGETLPEHLWVDINFPAICEDAENDLLGRKEGEILWPEQMSKETLVNYRKSMGNYMFSSIYQGNPVSRDGTLFKREWFYDYEDNHPLCLIDKKDVPEGLPTMRYWDFAANGDTEKNLTGDETSGVLTAFDGTNLYVLDVVNGHFTSRGVGEIFYKTALKDGKNTKIYVEEEPGSGGRILISSFQSKLKGYSIKGDKVKTAKNIRSYQLEIMAESQNIKFVKASWTTKMIEQLINFTGKDGERDDIVDSLTGSARMWTKRKTKIII